MTSQSIVYNDIIQELLQQNFHQGNVIILFWTSSLAILPSNLSCLDCGSSWCTGQSKNELLENACHVRAESLIDMG